MYDIGERVYFCGQTVCYGGTWECDCVATAVNLDLQMQGGGGGGGGEKRKKKRFFVKGKMPGLDKHK